MNSLRTRKGETNKNWQGLRMAVLEYRTATDVDVIFADDAIVRGVSYAAFKSGRVAHPAKMRDGGLVGESRLSADGKRMTVIEQRGEDSLTVRFEDGDIVCGVASADFVRGDVATGGGNDARAALFEEPAVRGLGIARERQLTFDNVRHILEKHRRCAMIRPCGFGKTWIGVRLFGLPRYERCLFLHPQKDELNLAKVKASGAKADTRTYAWLRKLNDKAIRSLEYDLVFMDECHVLGGDEDGVGAAVTYAAVQKLMRWHPETHFLGATATAIRMDGIDVIEKVFQNHVCYPYTDADAFEDGLLKPPHYFYNVYDIEKKIRERVAKAKKMYGVTLHLRREQVEAILGDESVCKVDARHMDRHIREKCDALLPSTAYMRFMAFYLTNKGIEANRGRVEQWFAKAYPRHQIVSTVVTNRTAVSLAAVDALPTAPTKAGYAGRIDLVFSCEKLCMGYHSEHVTGLILDRKTASIAKYQQMLGRLLSCDAKRPAIIFDIADNLHSDFVCKIRVTEAQSGGEALDVPCDETFQSVIRRYPASVHWERVFGNSRPMAAPPERTRESGTAPAASAPKGEGLQVLSLDGLETREAGRPQAAPHDGVLEAPRQRSNLGLVRQEPASAGEPLTQREVSASPMEEEGFAPGIYYYVNGDLFSRNIRIRTESADAEEAIDRMLQRWAEDTCKAVIDKWRTYPGCEDEYASEADVDLASGKYRFLKACADIYGCPVGAVLRYMMNNAGGDARMAM